jgi:hypothetical protein
VNDRAAMRHDDGVADTAQTHVAVETRAVADYIAAMDRIDGWLSRNDARCFVHVDEVQKAAGVEGDLIEIGVWHGRGAILFHHLARASERVLAVDIFDLRDRTHSHFNDPAQLRAHAAAFGCDERLVEVRMDTSRHGHRLLDVAGARPVRLVHIDGGHDYAVVRRDIEIASRLLQGGAVLVFDDFFNRKHPGTTQAIMEFMVTSPGYAAFMMTTKKLWVCHSDWHQRYFRHFRQAEAIRARSVLFNRPVLLHPEIR